MKTPSSLANVSPYRYSLVDRYNDSLFAKSFDTIRFIATAVIAVLIIAVPCAAWVIWDKIF